VQPTAVPYPATFAFVAPERVANWRPLVNWLLAIPHLLVLEVLQFVSSVFALISWFFILFTGRVPPDMARFQALYVRYYLRTATFVGFLREEYPAFAYAVVESDPGDDPRVRVDIEPELENRNRVTTAFRLILIIPHVVVLALLAIALWFVGVIAFFAVLFTGRWPDGLRNFAIGVGRWWLRVQAYGLLLTDQYPPFTLD
jgi:hypothetical protein